MTQVFGVSSFSYSVLAITEIFSVVLNLFKPLLLITTIDYQTLYHRNIAATCFGQRRSSSGTCCNRILLYIIKIISCDRKL